MVLDKIIPDFNLTLTNMVLNGLELDPNYYGCPEEIHKRPPSVPRPYWGMWFLGSGIVMLMLYIPCFFAIVTSPLLKSPAYKTMLVLAIYDISSIFIHSISTGILGFFGVPFCDYPRLIATLGGVALGSWMGCCIASMTLAVIRICDLSMQMNIKKCFAGNKIYFFLFSFFVYGVGAGILTKPVIFTPTHMSWFFDPMVGKNPEFYVNLPHTYNNIIMAICTIVFYGFLSYLAFRTADPNAQRSSSRKILLQSFFFCIFHTIASVLYAYMQFIAAPPFLILVSQIAWQISSGSVCIVYLTLNKTIRTSVMKMVCPKSYLYGRRISIMLSMNSNST
ncbi:Serpentine Receptor, class T [Caenorhabditis elegans]|uniref:Serpentine Receptor, class T n=1 Tax=Caenorhabditis elegans TaxID=6239 RepID=A0A168H5R9_CAEEL|nr:Serpentine Receptor, class T [Caenorhabditis elegans]SAP35580.1 Serpentine Receptor, class T [Caenorhabditis elegans]|eukprot:NP_001317820.1 Serpentine Receptor, class T [Caenorhabditis elegans]